MASAQGSLCLVWMILVYRYCCVVAMMAVDHASAVCLIDLRYLYRAVGFYKHFIVGAYLFSYAIWIVTHWSVSVDYQAFFRFIRFIVPVCFKQCALDLIHPSMTLVVIFGPVAFLFWYHV